MRAGGAREDSRLPEGGLSKLSSVASSVEVDVVLGELGHRTIGTPAGGRAEGATSDGDHRRAERLPE